MNYKNFLASAIIILFSFFLLPNIALATVDNVTTPKVGSFIQSLSSIQVRGGEPIELVVGWQNVGQESWHKYALIPKQKTTVVADNSDASFFDDSWQSRNVVVAETAAVAPDDVVQKMIRLRAPTEVGTYTAEFDLQVDDHLIEDVGVELSVTVTENAPNYVPPDESVPPPIAPTGEKREEPRIRVGFWKPDSFVQFRSDEADYDIFDGETKVGTLPKGRLGVLKYTDKHYIFTVGGTEFTSSNYFRLAPVGNPHAVFTLLNLKRTIKSQGKNNFNSYRGAMEYRLTQDGKTMYVINDLLFEDYVAGIAETSNGAPIEYIKALLTAARTYAAYVQQSTNKHDKRNFDVVGSTGDQLYLGYVLEQIAPHIAEAAAATRGYYIIYNHAIVITPYFGHSNGKTKSWVSVWHGEPKPWLVSVKAKYDKGLRQFGHGVGMSQRDAAVRADKEKIDWQTLVKYYYTGVEIEKMYD